MSAKTVLAAVLLICPTSAEANFIWPPLYYAEAAYRTSAVLIGLLIEGIVFSFAWPMELRRLVLFTLGVNLVSALAGVLYVGFAALVATSEAEILLLRYTFAAPVALFLLTVLLENAAGRQFFGLPANWRTFGIFAAANAPSVALALYASLIVAAGSR